MLMVAVAVVAVVTSITRTSQKRKRGSRNQESKVLSYHYEGSHDTGGSFFGEKNS